MLQNLLLSLIDTATEVWHRTFLPAKVPPQTSWSIKTGKCLENNKSKVRKKQFLNSSIKEWRQPSSSKESHGWTPGATKHWLPYLGGIEKKRILRKMEHLIHFLFAILIWELLPQYFCRILLYFDLMQVHCLFRERASPRHTIIIYEFTCFIWQEWWW